MTWHATARRRDMTCCDVAATLRCEDRYRLCFARDFFSAKSRVYITGVFLGRPQGAAFGKRPLLGELFFGAPPDFFVLGPETYESVVCQSFDLHYIPITCFMLKTYMLHTSYRASSSITSCHARTHSCEESRAHRPAGLNDDKNDAKHGVLTSSSKRTEN